MHTKKYEQPFISKHFKTVNSTSGIQNDSVPQTPDTEKTVVKNQNTNEAAVSQTPVNKVSTAAANDVKPVAKDINNTSNIAPNEPVKATISPDAKQIDEYLMLKLYFDKKEGKDFLKTEPNQCLFWYNCDIPDAINAISKMPDGCFWRNNILKVEDVLKNERKNKNINVLKLTGEKSSKIVAENMGIKTIRMLMNIVDGGNVQGVWGFASGLLAQNAIGTAFILTNNTVSTEFSGITWKETELPELMNNKNIDMIVELDFYNPDKVNSVIFPNGFVREGLKNCKLQVPISILNNNNNNKNLASIKNIPKGSLITVKDLQSKEYIDIAKNVNAKSHKFVYTDKKIKCIDINESTGREKDDLDTTLKNVEHFVGYSLKKFFDNNKDNEKVLTEISQLVKSDKEWGNYWNTYLDKDKKTSYDNKVISKETTEKDKKQQQNESRKAMTLQDLKDSVPYKKEIKATVNIKSIQSGNLKHQKINSNQPSIKK